MPEIRRFFGIIDVLNEHAPPHFHAKYAGKEAAIRIDAGEVMDGDLGPRAARLVEQWRHLHGPDLMADRDLAQCRRPLNKIEPLK